MLQLAQQFVSFWGFVPLAVWACKFHAQSRRAGGGKTGKLGYWTLCRKAMLGVWPLPSLKRR